MGTFDDQHRQSLEDPQHFWGEAARAIHWYRQPLSVLDASNPPFYRWFSGGELNTCFNALDRWVDGGDGIDRRRGDQDALIYDSPVSNTVARYTYRQLRDRVATCAGLLRQLGVGRGDRVVIYMPMVPEAAIAMLACARIGAIHSVVFGGFAPHELAVRIDDAQPKVVVSASCGIEVKRVIEYKPLLDRAIAMATHKPERCVIFQRPMVRASLVAARDIDWREGMAQAQPAPCVPVAATDPLYVLYTSGTTGRPKGVVRDNGGHAVALRWSMSKIYGVRPGEVYWAASDVGWVVGHSYIVYGPLLAGCTSVLYEGKPVGTPDPGAFWRVIAEHRVSTLFTAPTAFRAIKKEDPGGAHLRRYDLTSFRALFLAGERTDPDTYRWAADLLHRPVIDHWWQTETGWPVAANCLGIEALPVKPGSPTKPVPGYQVDILATDGTVLPAATEGAIAIKLPLPPGTLPTLWNDDARYVSSYLAQFPGYYATGDGGFVDADGYLNVMGRIDDVINVAGHRLSTGAMEEVIATHPAVAECAVIGVADALKGQVPVGLVVLKAGVAIEPAALETALVQLIRERIGALASFRRTHVVARLPKTRSGKILRATMRAIADGRPVEVPSTIDDPAALEEIAGTLRRPAAE
ncbi:MAG: propionyl-CoA synthetase [Candidatus Binatia bacterium]